MDLLDLASFPLPLYKSFHPTITSHQPPSQPSQNQAPSNQVGANDCGFDACPTFGEQIPLVACGAQPSNKYIVMPRLKTK